MACTVVWVAVGFILGVATLIGLLYAFPQGPRF